MCLIDAQPNLSAIPSNFENQGLPLLRLVSPVAIQASCWTQIGPARSMDRKLSILTPGLSLKLGTNAVFVEYVIINKK